MTDKPDRVFPDVLSPETIDLAIGLNVRRIRKLRHMSMQALGNAVGLAPPQIQKYERGTNRISASTLFRFCGFLGRPVAWFYDGLEPTGSASPGEPDAITTLMASGEGTRLALAMARLSPAMRRKVLAVLRAFLPDLADGAI